MTVLPFAIRKTLDVQLEELREGRLINMYRMSQDRSGVRLGCQADEVATGQPRLNQAMSVDRWAGGHRVGVCFGFMALRLGR